MGFGKSDSGVWFDVRVEEKADSRGDARSKYTKSRETLGAAQPLFGDPG
jgi:hypothetical protein